MSKQKAQQIVEIIGQMITIRLILILEKSVNPKHELLLLESFEQQLVTLLTEEK